MDITAWYHTIITTHLSKHEIWLIIRFEIRLIRAVIKGLSRGMKDQAGKLSATCRAYAGGVAKHMNEPCHAHE